MQLSSPAFDDGGTIPRGYAENGHNLLPPLDMEEVPPVAAILVVACFSLTRALRREYRVEGAAPPWH